MELKFIELNFIEIIKIEIKVCAIDLISYKWDVRKVITVSSDWSDLEQEFFSRKWVKLFIYCNIITKFNHKMANSVIFIERTSINAFLNSELSTNIISSMKRCLLGH